MIAAAVLRALLDLARDWPGAPDDLEAHFIAWEHAGGVSLNLLAPDMRRLTVLALSYACDRAIAGERSARSGEDAAAGERLIVGAEAVYAFLLADFIDES